ncbi:ParB/RepB/Spo0J family partition protein [Shewanella sp. GD03713]|uniref:ParB/RepB/Spo0J family partition protein n=1 Tax=Shewanella sp. GD03713 TaxID=2975372 RepID=UPI00244D267A|nr:ParB/RepB/Spo0J family partition protein [Shewanella sp. GD03713]MDH1472567.1 ParB/RepB/Spo0J family partition protein [Shewanella sp. GD03713]
MQTQVATSIQPQYQPLIIADGTDFDFTALPDGTPIRVSPLLIDDLSVGGNKRRKKERNADFKESIRTKGVIQSLSVRPNVNNPHRLELCAGYGRRDAAIEFGLSDVPVIVKHYGDKEAVATMLTENKERENISIVDEADLAQSYLSLHDGDYSSAATHLGLSEKVFRERLQLKRLTDNVLDKLADDSNKFTLGHALILSTFDEETQEKTLSAILADPATYTVKELKLRASKRQLPLATAPFDTSECKTCQHNTGEQFDLLGDGEVEANCSLASCFNEKAQDWVRTKRVTELEEKFGRVILWEAKPEADRRTVESKLVGEKQFSDGCMNCENKCVVVDDRPMRWGQHIENQCIDTDCFNTCANNHKNAQEAEKKAAQKAERDEAKGSRSQGNSTKGKTSTVVTTEVSPIMRKTSSAVMEDYRAQLRMSSSQVVITDPQFRLALALGSLCDLSNYEPEIYKQQNDRFMSFNDRVLLYMTLDVNTIQSEMGKAVLHHATVGGKESTSPTDLMIRALAQRDDGIAVATKDWNPSKKRLEMYNIAQIQQMCKDSGFELAYVAEHGEVGISALFKNRKEDIINGVMAFKFDWTHYAPDDYIALISQ